MEILKTRAAKFFSSQKCTKPDLQDGIDDDEVVKRMINIVQSTNNTINYDFEIGDIIQLICKYYEKNPAAKHRMSLLNFVCNSICDLLTLEPVDSENRYDTTKGYIQMIKDIDKFGRKIQKHMEVFDKNEMSAMLGGYYIIYCNIAMRLMYLFFPDFTTSYEQTNNFERYLICAQIRKKNACIKMYYDN